MTFGGEILAEARERLAALRAENEAEQRRRLARVYSRVPAVRETDEALRLQMLALASAVLDGGSIESIRAENLDLQARRAELMAENGLPMDYTDELYSCPLCRDRGYVDGRMCSCLARLCGAVQAEKLSSLLRAGDESFDNFDLSYYSPTPDPSTGIAPREQMDIVFEACRDYAAGFGPGSVNLLLQGGTGLGKTFLAASIARRVSGRGFSVVYDTAVAALDAFEQKKFSRPGEEPEEAAHRVTRMLSCDLMILDDLGTEMTTSFSQSALYTLVNSRLTDGKKTLITTNLTPDELSRRYTPQIVSRLEGEYQTLQFAGRDIRRIKKERG